MKRQSIARIVMATMFVWICFGIFSVQAAPLNAAQEQEVAESPCGASIAYLVDQYQNNPDVAASFELIAGHFVDPPESYHLVNPWRVTGGDELLSKMVDYFIEWCTFLPCIEGSKDNGLTYIQRFGWFYYQNIPAQNFMQGRNPLDPSQELETGLKFTTDFSKQRGAFMDGPDSTTYIQEWIDDPRIEIEDYRRRKASDYQSRKPKPVAIPSRRPSAQLPPSTRPPPSTWPMAARSIVSAPCSSTSAAGYAMPADL